MLGHVPDRKYRVVVEGELSDTMEVAFDGMTLSRGKGNTALRGTIRDQAELQGLLQRVSEFGLTLLEVTCVDAVEQAEGQRCVFASVRDHGSEPSR
jgi:hypothetical protein